uniref:Uncharacterized protein n=1 Tax=Setaria digitata TaxID=48799 RepID=A0A915PY04_9BILA
MGTTATTVDRKENESSRVESSGTPAQWEVLVRKSEQRDQTGLGIQFFFITIGRGRQHKRHAFSYVYPYMDNTSRDAYTTAILNVVYVYPYPHTNIHIHVHVKQTANNASQVNGCLQFRKHVYGTLIRERRGKDMHVSRARKVPYRTYQPSVSATRDVEVDKEVQRLPVSTEQCLRLSPRQIHTGVCIKEPKEDAKGPRYRAPACTVVHADEGACGNERGRQEGRLTRNMIPNDGSRDTLREERFTRVYPDGIVAGDESRWTGDLPVYQLNDV